MVTDLLSETAQVNSGDEGRRRRRREESRLRITSQGASVRSTAWQVPLLFSLVLCRNFSQVGCAG